LIRCCASSDHSRPIERLVRVEGFDALRGFLDTFWDVRLARLKAAAEAAELEKS
jgi:hypothetical protein